jgi:hypothetical protein
MTAIRNFRKKPVVIEACRFTRENSVVAAVWSMAVFKDTEETALLIDTLEGTMEARLGDWIIKGVGGEFYPCKPDIFEATYDPVEGEGEE